MTMTIADLYYRNKYGHIVVCGWDDRGIYTEQMFCGYTLKEVRRTLSAYHVRGAWKFRKIQRSLVISRK